MKTALKKLTVGKPTFVRTIFFSLLFLVFFIGILVLLINSPA